MLAATGCDEDHGRGAPPDLAACVGVGCNVSACTAGTETTLAGTLFAPNGKDPVPNATVYIPATAPAAFPDGIACDLCGTISGAVATALTRADGGFLLTGVPEGDVQVVAELGRFRRVTRMTVQKCVQNLVPQDPGTFGIKLPGRDGELSVEDRIPKIAVATGDYDQIECVLKRMGITQFDLYNDRNVGATLPTTIAELSTLLTDRARLEKYNLLVVNCTEAQFEPILKVPGVLANLEHFVGGGGRIYATDWAYDVINQVPEFAPYLCFVKGGVLGATPPATCSSLPGTAAEAHSTTPYDTGATIKDPTMRDWLANFPNTLVGGQVPISFNFVVINQTGDMTHPATTWAEGLAEAQGSLPMMSKGVRPLTVTFDYKQCGRIHYSTYNTEPAAVVDDSTNGRYPLCGGRTAFNAQERLLEYLLFTIAQCVGPIA